MPCQTVYKRSAAGTNNIYAVRYPVPYQSLGVSGTYPSASGFVQLPEALASSLASTLGHTTILTCH